MTKFVGYLRVSTGKQQQSGLGLEAQAEAIRGHVSACGGELIETLVEVESGSIKDRPQLASALALCRRRRATLIIAKLDRLARNVAFVATLMEAGTDFVAVDAPYANRLMLHIMSAFAEHEREEISLRTKAALAAAKARGVALGAQGKVLAIQNQIEAQRHAEGLRGAIQQARLSGAASLVDFAGFLSENGHPTASGGKWHPTTVKRLLTRLDE